MSAARLLATIQAAGVRLHRRGPRLTYAAPASVLTNEMLQQLRQHKAQLLALLPDDLRRPVLWFRLPSHPTDTWATAIGTPGQSQTSLEAGLRERWPDVELHSPSRPGKSRFEGEAMKAGARNPHPRGAVSGDQTERG